MWDGMLTECIRPAFLNSNIIIIGEFLKSCVSTILANKNINWFRISVTKRMCPHAYRFGVGVVGGFDWPNSAAPQDPGIFNIFCQLGGRNSIEK